MKSSGNRANKEPEIGANLVKGLLSGAKSHVLLIALLHQFLPKYKFKRSCKLIHTNCWLLCLMTDQNHCISSSPFSVWVYSSLIFDISLNCQGSPRWWGIPDSQMIRDLKQKPTFSYIFGIKKKKKWSDNRTKLSKPYFLAGPNAQAMRVYF